MIKLLDSQTADGIAAGEVIERPASVVKELVENAFDAGAEKVSVSIGKGGRKSIIVSDDGCGIPADEVELAFKRHATGKIESLNDLFTIRTMGFRGEALASIAAVSKVNLRTCESGEAEGVEIELEAGKVVRKSSIALPAGSRFEVRDLFYNVPARYKFLKRDSTEAGYINDICQKLALTRPDIAVSFSRDGFEVFSSPGDGDPLHAFYAVYGRETAEAAIPLHYEEERIYVAGFICSADMAFGNRSRQVVCVNNRLVVSSVIRQAIDEAGKTWFMKRKYPVLLLYITVPPMDVDFNVHPQKTELRFADNKPVFRAVYRAIQSAFTKHSGIASANTSAIRSKRHSIESADQALPKENAETDFKASQVTSEILKPASASDHSRSAREIEKKSFDSSQISADILSEKEACYDSGELTSSASKSSKKEDAAAISHIINFDETVQSAKAADYKSDKAGEHLRLEDVDENLIDENLKERDSSSYTDIFAEVNAEAETKIDLLKDAEYLGQVLLTYLVFESKKGLILIDQHAAHERIIYEQIKKRFHNTPIEERQPLLIPAEFTPGIKAIAEMEEEREMIESLGFVFDRFGEDTILLREEPLVFPGRGNAQDAFAAICDRAAESSLSLKGDEEELLYDLACKAAIKAGRSLHSSEIELIRNELVKCDNPYHCPHGRPCIILFDRNDLEKLFKRVV